MRTLVPVAIIVVLAAILLPQVFYAVDETQSVVITRLGEVISVKTSPGLAIRTPFIDTVNRFDNRLLRIDVPTASLPDRLSQFLEIDAYVRYRITDPRRFLERLADEFTASARIGQIVISEIRAEVGNRDREDIIGGTPISQPDGTIIVQPRLNADGIATRDAMMRLVQDRANRRVTSAENDFGIEIIDVRIKRADFPDAARQSIYQRMRTERDVQAQALRSQGEEEYLTITAQVDQKVQGEILAQANRDADILRGEGEAQAIKILAEALEQDPEFYAFRRSLEAYTKFLVEKTTVVLPADSDLFKYLLSPNPPAEEEEPAP